MGLTSTFVDWWRRRRLGVPRIDRIEYMTSPNDLPDQISRRVVYVVGNSAYQKWAMFMCPCGTGHLITLNLQVTRTPSWSFRRDDTGPSISPSVDSYGDRRCHFWLRGGRVTWAHDRTS